MRRVCPLVGSRSSARWSGGDQTRRKASLLGLGGPRGLLGGLAPEGFVSNDLRCNSLLLSAAGNVSVGCSLMAMHRADFPGEPLYGEVSLALRDTGLTDKRKSPTVDISQLLSVGPRMRSLNRRLRLQVRVKEHSISRDALRFQSIGNVFRLAQEVNGNVLDSVALLWSEQVHHLLGRRTAG